MKKLSVRLSKAGLTDEEVVEVMKFVRSNPVFGLLLPRVFQGRTVDPISYLREIQARCESLGINPGRLDKILRKTKTTDPAKVFEFVEKYGVDVWFEENLFQDCFQEELPVHGPEVVDWIQM